MLYRFGYNAQYFLATLRVCDEELYLKLGRLVSEFHGYEVQLDQLVELIKSEKLNKDTSIAEIQVSPLHWSTWCPAINTFNRKLLTDLTPWPTSTWHPMWCHTGVVGSGCVTTCSARTDLSSSNSCVWNSSWHLYVRHVRQTTLKSTCLSRHSSTMTSFVLSLTPLGKS